MKRDDVFPSKYLKAADLNGKPVTITIKSAPYETFKNPEGKEQGKTVLYFVGGKKALPLNIVNWDSVAEICGDDTDAWPGHQIELYPTVTQMGGKRSPASAFGARKERCRWRRGREQRRHRCQQKRRRSRRTLTQLRRRPARGVSLKVDAAMIRAALAYARKGLQIFPCQPRAKRPATANGLKDATTDPDRIRAWWHHEPAFNVAIATGAVSGVFVVDVDGLDAEAELRRLEAEHGTLPATIEAITARGRHVYFKMTAAGAQFGQQGRARNRYQGRRRLRAGAAEHSSERAALLLVSRLRPRHCRRASVAAGQDRNA